MPDSSVMSYTGERQPKEAIARNIAGVMAYKSSSIVRSRPLCDDPAFPSYARAAEARDLGCMVPH